ncbi:uncharacterized protein LOC107807363 isoform X2 [Nicotiana tabacum]|uniref:Uncharacterized protein LOC107807363 isoform X2 n=1 Tax=Nicotiana tabacum TaxID=4097 RepID=A0AC58TJL9_TOBAC
MEAHKLFEEARKRSYLFANLYAWEHEGGVARGVECSCNFRNSHASYKLRIVREAQVKCDPLNAKIVAGCLMIYGGYLGVETIGRVRATNTSLDYKVLFEDGSIVVNQPYLGRDYGPEMRNGADRTIVPRAKGPVIEQANRILARSIWDPGKIRGMVLKKKMYAPLISLLCV